MSGTFTDKGVSFALRISNELHKTASRFVAFGCAGTKAKSPFTLDPHRNGDIRFNDRADGTPQRHRHNGGACAGGGEVFNNLEAAL